MNQQPSSCSTNPTRIPAFILIALSVLNLAAIMNMGSDSSQKIAQDTNANISESERRVNAARSLTTDAVKVVHAIFLLAILAGSVSMLRAGNLKSARSAAVLATIPFLSPLFVLGIPFGIWANVLLNKPDVKRIFNSN